MVYLLYVLSFLSFLSLFYDYAAHADEFPVNRITYANAANGRDIYKITDAYGTQARLNINREDDGKITVDVTVENDTLPGTGSNCTQVIPHNVCYTVDIYPEIQGAISAWNRVLQPSFSLQENPVNSHMLIRLEDDPDFFDAGEPEDEEELEPVFALTYARGTFLQTEASDDDNIETPGIYINQDITISSDTLKRIMTSTGVIDEVEAIRILYYTVFVHEFGHLLGLMHPDAGSEYSLLVVAPNYSDFAPIMVGDPVEYLERRRQQLRRVVVRNDIVPNVREVETVQQAINGCLVTAPRNAVLYNKGADVCDADQLPRVYDPSAVIPSAVFILGAPE